MNSISAFFLAEKSPSGKLARIEGLVVITAIILLLISILDSYRRRSRSSFLKLTCLILDTVSASTVTYTTGLIQAAPFENQLLPVWAILLTILQQSINISAYGVEQSQARRRNEIRDLMESFWVAYLNATQGVMFKYPLWFLWSLNCSKIFHRMISYESATRSYSIGKNSLLVADYMKYEHELTEPDQVDPAVMRGYKYLVLGEDKQKIEPEVPSYLMKLRKTHEKRLITLDKIWQCNGRLLSATGGDSNGHLKDLCLSFSMSKLLHRRFRRLQPKPDHQKHHDLILNCLISKEGDSERPFRVVGAELAFLSDFFYTRYPIIFSNGFPVLNIVLNLMIGVTCCFVLGMLTNFNAPSSDLEHIEHGVNVGKVITILLLLVIIVKELWEIITFIFSDWAKVVLICKYVEKPSWQKSVIFDKLLRFLCHHRITKSWHGKIGQYSLLTSYNYKPWNLGCKLTCGLIGEKLNGEKAYELIKLPEGVKKAVLGSLVSNNGQIENGKLSLERNEVIQQLSFAINLQTATHTIMVWHIATSLCEIELLQKHKQKQDVKNPTRIKIYMARLRSCLRACVSYLKNWWRPQSFFVNIEDLEGDLQCKYEIAASLSRYCAYLVVYKGELVSDPYPAVECIFGNIVLEAQKLLGDHGSWKSKYKKLMAEQATSDTIIAKGSELGKKLIETVENDEQRWKVLADFWAEWILYIAPSDHIKSHEISLQKGGEFMTHLWALLSHCGIFDRPGHEAPDSSV